MITRAKVNSVSNQRLLAQKLTPEMVKKLFNDVALKYKDRQGGYTRIMKLGPRTSDGAKMVIIELVK
jgi:large subunit ribosomal protein L17